jgi:hypothetical protein
MAGMMMAVVDDLKMGRLQRVAQAARGRAAVAVSVIAPI